MSEFGLRSRLVTGLLPGLKVSVTLSRMDPKPILSRPPVSVLSVPIPKTQPLSYEKTFSKVDDLTAVQLKRISEFRQEVVVASERSFADAAIKVRAVPLFRGLAQSWAVATAFLLPLRIC